MALPDITQSTLELVTAGNDRALSATVDDANNTGQLVTQGWSDAHAFAQNAYNAATSYIRELEVIARNIFGNIPAIDPNIALRNLDLSAFNYLLANAPPTIGNNFTFTETIYSANLLTDLRAQLLAWIDGVSTGLAPAVEQAIWDRGRNREAVNANRKIGEAIRTFATRGFSKPPGALSQEIQAALQESQNINSTFSRDVAIKQAELEQSNRRFSFEQAWKVEEGAIAYTNQQMTRLLEKGKLLQQFFVDIYQQDIAKFAAGIQNYTARVNAETAVFRAQVDQNVAEANIRIEAAKANLQAAIQEATAILEAIKAGAQVSAQLAASALSSVSLSGALHSSISLGASISDSRSAQTSASVQASDSITNTATIT